MLRRHIVLLIAIRPSDGDVKPGGSLGVFDKSRLWAGTGFHLLPSFHYHPTLHNTVTLHKQLHIQSPYPQLPTVHYYDTRPTRNVVCPSSAWFENRPHSISSICLVQNPKRLIVQWVGIGTHTLSLFIPQCCQNSELVFASSNGKTTKLCGDLNMRFFCKITKVLWNTLEIIAFRQAICRL